jgi:hypothetical protein
MTDMKVMLTVSLLAGLTAAEAWAGPKFYMDGSNSWISVGFLGQVHYSNTENAKPEDDIYLRRARIIVSGQITDGVQFFAETDNDNAGKSGQASVSTDIQDAFADVRLMKTDNGSEHWVKAGLILLPFSFETRSSAASLLGLDYNSEVIKLANTFVWRDYGAEFHGNAGTRFSYAAGVFDGYDMKDSDKNPDAGLRFTGHAAFNLLGNAEKEWFFTQERPAKTSHYISLGAGFDTQDRATLKVTPATNSVPESRTEYDSENWVIDVQSGFVLKSLMLTLNLGHYDWDNAGFKGTTAFAEAGIMYGKNQLTVKYSDQDPDQKDSTTDYTVGVHHFLKNHNARGGIEFRSGDSPDMVLAGIQFLI